jgi:uncharacterized membrane protein YgcG
MVWLVLCVIAAVAAAWIVKRSIGGASGYDIYEDDTLPDYPMSFGWNYWQCWHLHQHQEGGDGGGSGGSDSGSHSGGGAAGGGGGSW